MPVKAPLVGGVADAALSDVAETIERALDMAKLKTHLAKMDINDLASDATMMFSAANRRLRSMQMTTVPAAILGAVGHGCLRLRDRMVQ